MKLAYDNWNPPEHLTVYEYLDQAAAMVSIGGLGVDDFKRLLRIILTAYNASNRDHVDHAAHVIMRSLGIDWSIVNAPKIVRDITPDTASNIDTIDEDLTYALKVIRERMAIENVSVSEAARRTGIGRGKLSVAFHGGPGRPLTARELLVLCRTVGLSMEDLGL